MTDSAYYFGPHPNDPGHFNQVREWTDEENATDALLLLYAAKRVGEVEAYLDSLKPGAMAQDPTYDALDMAQNLQAHLLESAQAISPEAYREWCRLENDKGPVRLFKTLRQV